MIRVTRLDETEYYINIDFIEWIEETPDTVISLTTNKRLIVRESAEELIERIIEFKRSLFKNQLMNKGRPVENPNRSIGSFDWIEGDVIEDDADES